VRWPSLTTTIAYLIAIPTSAALGLYGWLFLRSMLRHPTLEHLIVLLSLWQAMTGAAFAIAAALLGAGVILYQTQEARHLADERRKRRAVALRAVLPLALMELSGYAIECATILMRGLRTKPNGLHVDSEPPEAIHVPPGALLVPPVPNGLESRLTELIETTACNHTRPLIVLIRRLQIQQGRAREMGGRGTVTRADLIGGVIDAAEIFARCSKLFPYARGETDAPVSALTSNFVKQVLWAMSIDLPDMEPLIKEIELRAKGDQNWPEALLSVGGGPHVASRRA
jgi:hypothetical protein